MRVKTFIKIEADGQKIKKDHSGTSGVIMSLDITQKPAQLNIEIFGSDQEIQALTSNFLIMLHDRYEVVAQNAVTDYEKVIKVKKGGDLKSGK